MAPSTPPSRAWWKESSVYQVYPASFQDSTGSGAGDLKGIISRVDYLKDLGVDIVWLSPIFDSPQIDMGYDVSNYKVIYPPYGDVSDVDTLRDKLHERGMKLVLDLVMNHTSDQNEWFKESRKSKDNPYRDWYVWKPAKYDAQGNRQPPNNWQSHFQGNAWTYDETTDEYYLHLYCKEQPDLNWENPAVRAKVHEVMRFWLDRGADGFRMDVINFVSKDQSFPDSSHKLEKGREYGGGPAGHEFYACGPRCHEYLHEIGEILKEYDAFSVGEMPCVTDEHEIIKAVASGRDELSMIFHFELMNIDHGPSGKNSPGNWSLSDLKKIVNKWQRFMIDNNGWNALYFENHDQPRCVSRFVDDSPEHRVASAKLMGTFLAFQSGTPFVYQGQELGMTNVPKDWPIEEYQDIDCLNHWNLFKDTADAKTLEELKVQYQLKSRDNARTPMQWDSSPHAGFTSGSKPWMRVNDNYTAINAAAQTPDPDSVFHHYRRALEARKANKEIFVYGDFELVDESHDKVFAYRRVAENGAAALVICNFTAEPVAWKLPSKAREVVLTSTDRTTDEVNAADLTLKPCESLVVLL